MSGVGRGARSYGRPETWWAGCPPEPVGGTPPGGTGANAVHCKGVVMSKMFRKLMKDESGASLVEYVLLVALIGVVAIGAMTLVGGNATTTLNTAGNAMP